MKFSEFNESIDNKIDNFSDILEKYNIFTESVAEQLNINIEKAKLYVQESEGTNDDLMYLISEAEAEADKKDQSAVDKLQKSIVDTFNGMADDLYSYADSAKVKHSFDKIKSDNSVANNKVNVKVLGTIDTFDKVRSEIIAKITVLTVNVNATISEKEMNKIDETVKRTIASVSKNYTEKTITVSEAVSLYEKALNDMKTDVNTNKKIGKDMSDISSKKWNERSTKNKSQITQLISKLSSVMNAKISELKSNVSNISSAIKTAIKAKSDDSNNVKKESVAVSDLLTSIIEKTADDFVNNMNESEDTIDESDKILAEIEAEIEEAENAQIDDIKDITFDESTNIDDIVNDFMEELM